MEERYGVSSLYSIDTPIFDIRFDIRFLFLILERRTIPPSNDTKNDIFAIKRVAHDVFAPRCHVVFVPGPPIAVASVCFDGEGGEVAEFVE